mgnify:CR=1 FL=1
MATFTPFGCTFHTETLDIDTEGLRDAPHVDQDYTFKERGIEYEDMYRVLEKFPVVRDAIEDRFNTWWNKTFGPGKFWITTSWTTKMRSGESIRLHRHKNAVYSGLYYYGNYTNQSGPLKFQNPIPELLFTNLWFNRSTKAGTLFQDWEIAPKKNLLVFFPAHIAHTCEAINAPERVSLAFNVMPCKLGFRSDSHFDPAWFNDRE